MNHVAARPALHAADRLDLISLCTGGGGLDLGVELAIEGARPVCYVEREAFACAHLVAAIEAGLMADAPLWTDARTFDGRAWRGAVDGVIGGIPCQPHSLAGQRKGADDERDLWPDARRIIVQSRAWLVLIENVAGMLSAPAGQIAGAERVWRDLQRLGFAVEIGLFSAAEVGASHGRERVFILGLADPQRGSSRQRHGAEMLGRWAPDAKQAGLAGGVMADAGGARPQGRERDRSSGSGDGPQASQPAAELCRTHLVDATPGRGREGRPEPGLRRGRDAAAGAERAMAHADLAVVSGQPSAGQQPVDEPDAGTGRADLGIFPPGPGEADRWAVIADLYPEGLPALSRHDRFRIALRASVSAAHGHSGAREGLAPHAAGAVPPARVPAAAQPDLRRVAHGLAAAMDDDSAWSRTERLAMLGNGVVPLQAAYALRTLIARLAARNAAGADRLVRMMEHSTSKADRPSGPLAGSAPAKAGAAREDRT